LLLSAILGVLLGLLILAVLPPWIFVYALTHPACKTPAILKALPPLEEHFLQTADGLALRAWYYPSRNHGAIIALGGMGGSLGTDLPPVERLVRRGYGVLQIEGRACAKPPAPVTLGYREAEDAAAGLAFLKTRPEVDAQRIGIFGFSMGGAAAIRFAARESGIAVVVADGGYSNLAANFDAYGSGGFYTRVVGCLSRLGYQALTGVNPAHSSPVDDVGRISPRPLLLIYGEAEAGPPVEALWQAARPPKELWLVPGGSHGTNHAAAPEEYERRVVEFFNQALRP
jgi:fermentation-respiration switch protein FrsA (DUF1100 family)